jgi:type III secretion protein Q
MSLSENIGSYPAAIQLEAGVTRKPMPAWRLELLSVAECKLLNLTAMLVDNRSSLRWLRGPRSEGGVHAVRLTLDVGGESVPVYVCASRATERLGFQWFGSESASKQAALWTSRASRIWQRLERFCGAPVLVKAAAVEPVPAGWLRFSMHLGGAEIGCWLEAESVLRALVWRSAAPVHAPAMSLVAGLEVDCALRLSEVSISSHDLQGLTRGDVIIVSFEKDSQLPGTLEPLGTSLRYPVLYDRRGLMTISNSVLELNEQAELRVVGETEVELSVELATCSMSLGELANLRPGSAMRLNKPVDELTVVLKYHGQRIASGSLLEIGGVLGIHLNDVSLGAPV